MTLALLLQFITMPFTDALSPKFCPATPPALFALLDIPATVTSPPFSQFISSPAVLAPTIPPAQLFSALVTLFVTVPLF
ncbi:MAG: hypothetical protein LUE09_02875 [Synergistaceae bacterium]|nr:hypothetical protein [Synergistaceae bacterium]